VRKKRPELWKKISRILHQDNAPPRNALAVKQSLADKCIPVLEKPTYSQDLAPYDFYLFPKLKSALKGTNFLFVCEVKLKTNPLSRVSADELHNCFEGWKIRMQRYIDQGESTLKGITINLKDFENNPDFLDQSRYSIATHRIFVLIRS
jgi:hypothetical protein